MNDAERGKPIKSPHELQKELSDVGERAVVGGYDRNDPDGMHMSVPSDDEPWSVADVLSGMMAGQHAHGTCIEVYGYELHNTTISDDLANVWTVHPTDSGRAIDAINFDNFATASEIETYLLEGELEGR